MDSGTAANASISSAQDRSEIFGRPHTIYTINLSREILTTFERPWKTRDSRATMQGRLRELEAIMDYGDRQILEDLLKSGTAISHQAIEDGSVREGQQDELEKECDICAEVKPVSEFHEGKITPRCKHYSSIICKDCLGRDIDIQLETKLWHTLNCTFCRSTMPTDLVQQYIDSDRFEKYRDYMTAYQIKDLKNFCWCAHSSCRCGQVHLNLKTRQMVCIKCGNVTCYRCKIPWHNGQTCKAAIAEYYQGRYETEEELSAAAIARLTNTCPKCKVPIQRDGGCQHMRCSQCRTRFNWVTHSPIDPGPFAEANPLPPVAPVGVRAYGNFRDLPPGIIIRAAPAPAPAPDPAPPPAPAPAPYQLDEDAPYQLDEDTPMD